MLVGLLVFLGSLVAPVVSGGGARAQTVPPHLDYRTFETPHFDVVYPEGLREVALRAAAHAEEGYRLLSEDFFEPPSEKIELLVTDHTDLSNGFARSTPSPRIVLWVRPPMDATALSQFDEWLGFVTVHELAHILYLEQTGALGRALRRVLGRPPVAWPFFQGYLLPQWAVEGVAVQAESHHTEGGRLHGTAFDATVRAQALGEGVDDLGRALGRSPQWPAGDRPYIYGSLFFEWLDHRFGEGITLAILDDLARQWVPYRLDAPVRTATGSSLGELWEEWVASVEEEAASRAGRAGVAAPLELLTHSARTAVHPAPEPSGGGVVYLRADGRSEVRLVRRNPDGEESTLTRWNSVSRPVWTPGGNILASQLEFQDPWRLRGDLFLTTPEGRSERLTWDARISHVDARPVTGEIVAVQEGGGTNRLVLLSPEGEEIGVLKSANPAVHWAYPRWSPDGERLAVVRHRRGGANTIVLFTVGGPEIEILAEEAALHTTPAWSPDGRWVLWASNRDGAMNLFARQVAEGGPAGPLRQVTTTPSGAMYPAPDAEGRWIYLSVLGDDGWDLARTPLDPSGWIEPLPVASRFLRTLGGGSAAAMGPPPAEITGEDRPWSPLPSLLPRYWLPWIGSPESIGEVEVFPYAVGIETAGQDLVGRHAWSFVVGAAPTGSHPRPQARLLWRNGALGMPVLHFRAEQRFTPVGRTIAAGPPPDTLHIVSREWLAGADAEFVRRRMRSSTSFSVGLRYIHEHRSLLDLQGREPEGLRLSRPERRLVEARTFAGWSTLRQHPLSVTPEEGVALGVQLRRRWDQGPFPEDAVDAAPGPVLDEAIATARVFRPIPLPAFARGAVGVRGAVGAARGSGVGTGHFRVGGGGGGGEGWGGFTRDTDRPLFGVRGYPRGIIAGDRAWAGAVELRFPLALLNRGRGALPVHADRLAGGVFLEAAGAGRPGAPGASARSWERRAAAGVEVVLSGTVLFRESGRLRAGVAFPLESGASPGFYLQSGWAF
ncbi:MAG: hypothetical protein WD960_13110 [Gemmatimonadota bacterium]